MSPPDPVDPSQSPATPPDQQPAAGNSPSPEKSTLAAENPKAQPLQNSQVPPAKPTNPDVMPEVPFQSLASKTPPPPEIHAPLSGVVVIEDAVPESALPQPAKKALFKPTKPILLIILGGIFILGGGGASAYYLLKSQPERIWSHALQNTSKAIDELINKQSNITAKGRKVSGSFQLNKPFSIDGSLDSQFLDLDSKTNFSVNYSKVKVSLDALTKKAGDSTFPDIYLKLSGLDNLAKIVPYYSSYYLKLNNQWIFLDHASLDQITKLNGDITNLPSDSAAQQQDAAKIAGSFISAMLQSDSQKNVFVIDQKIGKEKFNGHSTYHYVVTINKDHLKNVVDQMKTVIDSTSFKATFPSNGYEEIKKNIDTADFSKTKIELWADTDPAIVRNIRLSPTDDMKAYIDIGTDYTSGDEVPLTVKYVIDDKGTKGSVEATLKFNSKTSALTFESSGDVSESSSATTLDYNLSFKVTPTDEPLNVTAPSGAKSYQEILNTLGFPNYDVPTQTGLSTYGCQYTKHLVVIPRCQELLKPTS